MLFFDGRQYAEQKYNRLLKRLRYTMIIDIFDDHKDVLKEVRARYNKIFAVR